MKNIILLLITALLFGGCKKDCDCTLTEFVRRRPTSGIWDEVRTESWYVDCNSGTVKEYTKEVDGVLRDHKDVVECIEK